MKKNTGTTSSLHYFKYKLISALNDSMILFYGGTDPLQSECYTLFEKLSSMDEFRSFYFVWILSDPEAHMDLLNFHHTILVREHSKESVWNILPRQDTGFMMKNIPLPFILAENEWNLHYQKTTLTATPA